MVLSTKLKENKCLCKKLSLLRFHDLKKKEKELLKILFEILTFKIILFFKS